MALQTSLPHDGVMATTRLRGGWHAKDTGGPEAHGGRQGGARARGEDQDRAGAAGGQGPHAAAGADGRSLAEIARSLGANVNTVALCVRKYREGGVEAALSDAARSGRPVVTVRPRFALSGDESKVRATTRARRAPTLFAIPGLAFCSWTTTGTPVLCAAE